MTTRSAPTSAVAAAVFLASAVLSAHTPPQQAASAAQPQVAVPDSREWTVEQAIVNLRSSDKGMRLAALQRLAKQPGLEIQKWIAEAARYDPEPRIRYEAVKALEARKESASLPILMHIAEVDKDDRVRTAARIASGVGETPGAQTGAPGQATQPPPTGPAAPTPPPPKRFDATGNELPPGYLDGDPGGAQVGVGGSGSGAKAKGDEIPWAVDVDPEAIDTGKKVAPRAHSGFLPQLGLDGAMGSPRDTLNRSDVGAQIGVGHGKFDRTVMMENDSGIIDGSNARAINRFTSTEFGLTILGHWSPGKYFEVGLSAEVLTVESMKHHQDWERWDNATEDGGWEKVVWKADASEILDTEYQLDEAEQLGVIYQDSSYKGAAFGLVSLDLKSVFLQTDVIRVGIALRTTFPTHTGARFDEGLGAADLYLPGVVNEATPAITGHFSRDGRVFGLEPGAVVSVSPVAHLTLYADLMFTMAILMFDEVSSNTGWKATQSSKVFNAYFIPHFGAQYRFLDERLGVQLAFSPVTYVGASGGAGLATFAIVPGIAFRALDHLNLSLTLDIDTGENAAHPFQCTHLKSNAEAQTTDPTTCGVGRQVGFALQTSWEF